MSAVKPKHYFMEHDQMDFETQILLGCCHYGAADAGEILAAVERVPSGDFEQRRATITCLRRCGNITLGMLSSRSNVPCSLPIPMTSSSGPGSPKRFMTRWFVPRSSFGSRLMRGPIGIASPRPAPYTTSACSIGWTRFCLGDPCRIDPKTFVLARVRPYTLTEQPESAQGSWDEHQGT
jgi:hypothetical protein